MISKQALMLLLNGQTLLLVLLGGISSSVAPGPPPPRPAVDPGRPKAAEDYKKDLNVLVGALIAIAQDEDQSGDTRLQAIFALGKINHPASLSFLLDHIDYRVSSWKYYPRSTRAFRDDDWTKDFPCEYALNHFADREVAYMIPERLDRPRTRSELSGYASVMNRWLSRESVVLIIEDELSKKPQGARKQNLETLIKEWYPDYKHVLSGTERP